MKTNEMNARSILHRVKRKGMRDLVRWLEVTDYFSAPASTRFHGSYRKGLVKHCENVYMLFREKNNRFCLGLSEETVIITAFLHDLCKVNLYKDNILKNGDKATIPYKTKEDLPIGHCTKSIFLISKFIELTKQEALIIRWHMSWSDYEFKKHIDAVKKIAPEVIAFICADMEAAEYLDK